jgi:hypothetical protein
MVAQDGPRDQRSFYLQKHRIITKSADRIGGCGCHASLAGANPACNPFRIGRFGWDLPVRARH